MIVPSGGVNETEPTLLQAEVLLDCDGAEYRAGQKGIYVARGRQNVGTISGVTGQGIYVAGFDGSPDYIVVQAGDSLYASVQGTSMSFSSLDSFSGSLPVVGCHYANRHYIATNVGNRRIELGPAGSGLASYPIGMSASTFSIGTSVSQTAGLMSAAIGLVYWVTEYDAVRGIESVTGSSVSTGAFSLKASVIATVTGSQTNQRANQLKWYRGIDGGGYPDGGLIAVTAIGTTQITDTLSNTANLNVPLYGLVSIGGLDTERDAAPPILSVIFGPFQDSLLGVSVAEPRNLRFTPSGFPDSWPAGYGIPINTQRQDDIVTGVVLPGRIGVFCSDSVQVISRLPRDSDSIFAAGEAMDTLTEARGCVSRRGACTFAPPGRSALAVWVSRDGIWASTLATSPIPLTDEENWQGRINTALLSSCRLMDDPLNRRLVFVYRRASDTTYNTGVWYLDYQAFSPGSILTGQGPSGIRITFADHGPLADVSTFEDSASVRRPISVDSRPGNGSVYIEANQDVDDSKLRDSSGSVRFRMRTKEFLPAEARGTVNLGKATWMHDAGPARIEHRAYYNRNDSNPVISTLLDPTTRNADDVQLGRNVNSVSLELASTGTASYGVHWFNIEGLEIGPLGGRKGA